MVPLGIIDLQPLMIFKFIPEKRHCLPHQPGSEDPGKPRFFVFVLHGQMPHSFVTPYVNPGRPAVSMQIEQETPDQIPYSIRIQHRQRHLLPLFAYKMIKKTYCHGC